MVTLVAYIPNFEIYHAEWFWKYRRFGIKLLLISQDVAEELLPTLKGCNTGAVPTSMTVCAINAQNRPFGFGIKDLFVINSGFNGDSLLLVPGITLPDEKMSRLFVDEYYNYDFQEADLDRISSRFDKELKVKYRAKKTKKTAVEKFETEVRSLAAIQ